MMKQITFLFLTILALNLIAATQVNIELSQTEFSAGEPITFKVTAIDESGKQIIGQAIVIVEDKDKKVKIEKTINLQDTVSIDLGTQASSGQGIITAKYQETEAIEFFEIGQTELVKFEISGNILKVTNIGNTEYTKTIKITIGETTGTKQPSLEIGESTTYRLVAPEGVYDIRISDGKNSITRSSVKLSGTGNAIGAIDDSASKRAGVTGGVSPNEEQDEALLGYIKNNTFIYVFIAVIFGATILIAIERRYKKKAKR